MPRLKNRLHERFAWLNDAFAVDGAQFTVRGEQQLELLFVTLPTAAAGGMAGRPDVAVPGLDDAFIAGDWVGTRGLLADAAIASGHDAAVAVARLLATRQTAPAAEQGGAG